MKLEATEGCTCYWYGIDGISIDELIDKDSKNYNPQLLKDVLVKMITTGKCDNILESMFQDIITQIGDCSFSHRCEDCGDSVYTYTLEI